MHLLGCRGGEFNLLSLFLCSCGFFHRFPLRLFFYLFPIFTANALLFLSLDFCVAILFLTFNGSHDYFFVFAKTCIHDGAM